MYVAESIPKLIEESCNFNDEMGANIKCVIARSGQKDIDG